MKPFTLDVRPFSSLRRNKLYLSMTTMDQKRLTVGFQVTFDIRLIVEPVAVKSGEVYLNINLNISK